MFCCCFRRRKRAQAVPDEESRLIPTYDDTSSIHDRYPESTSGFDHRKLQQTLGTIVKAKEGKMVNVSATLPFNLYNQPIRDISSSSRSGSESRSRYGFPPNYHRSRLAGSALSVVPVDGEEDSPERRNARRGSLTGEDTHISRGSTLDVRIVRDSDRNVAASSRRGRPKLRAGESGSSHGYEHANDTDEAIVEVPTPTANVASSSPAFKITSPINLSVSWDSDDE